MPKTPSSEPEWSTRCDPRLTDAALHYRRINNLLTVSDLGGINVTAWLYRNQQGVEDVKVNPNITIGQLRSTFGPAATPDAEVGFHSEMMAADWFTKQRGVTILQIFTERYPCKHMCGPMLRNRYPGVPWYFYYRPSSWKNESGQVIAKAAAILKSAYGLT